MSETLGPTQEAALFRPVGMSEMGGLPLGMPEIIPPDPLSPFIDTDFMPPLSGLQFSPYEGHSVIGTDMMLDDPRFVSLFELSPFELQRELEYMQKADALDLQFLGSPEQWDTMNGVQDDAPIMAHELGHALIAAETHDGHFSGRPDSDSRGKTRIYGPIADDAFSVMAAGSMFSHHFGEPEGYDSDHAKINYLFEYGEGFPLETAIQKAHNHLKQHEEIFALAAKISAAAQHILKLDAIPFSMLPQILNCARKHVEFKNEGIAQEVYKYLQIPDKSQLQALKAEIEMFLQNPSSYREISGRVDGTQHVSVVVDGLLVDSYENCPACSFRDGYHAEDCSLLTIQSTESAQPRPSVDVMTKSLGLNSFQPEAVTNDTDLSSFVNSKKNSDHVVNPPHFPNEGTIFVGTDYHPRVAIDMTPW